MLTIFIVFWTNLAGAKPLHPPPISCKTNFNKVLISTLRINEPTDKQRAIQAIEALKNPTRTLVRNESDLIKVESHALIERAEISNHYDIELASAKAVKEYYRKIPKELLTEKELSKVSKNLATEIHAKWQEKTRASGKTERFKPMMKVNGSVISNQEDLNSYLLQNKIPKELRQNYKLADDGKGNIIAQENILNIPNQYLAPNNALENNKSAMVITQYLHAYLGKKNLRGIMQRGNLTNYVHDASSFVHDQWIIRNEKIYSLPLELNVPFGELSAIEAQKDIDIVIEGMRQYQIQANP